MGAQANYGRVFSHCPHGVGCVTLLEHGCAHQPSSSLNAVVEGFLWRLHRVGTVGYELNPQLLSSPQRMEFRAESSKPIIMTWSLG